MLGTASLSFHLMFIPGSWSCLLVDGNTETLRQGHTNLYLELRSRASKSEEAAHQEIQGIHSPHWEIPAYAPVHHMVWRLGNLLYHDEQYTHDGWDFHQTRM